MSRRCCADCYYYDLCDRGEICEYYYPVDESVTEVDVAEMIEHGRIAFRSEWFEYIEEEKFF